VCNLYRLTRPGHETAHLFDAIVGPIGNAGPGEVYPGRTGLVVASGELRSMVWGFPLVLKGKSGQPLKPRPVNNARADKLDSFMWKASFRERRCLIPVSAFAEAEGAKGARTRTWFTLPGEAVFAVAGLWRETDEWGPAYTMVMTEACQHVAGVHDRMPVILRRADWADWLDGPPGSVADPQDHPAGLLCRPYPEQIAVERTPDPWVRR
jgi:putative SOS response-associated peptidase YedK